MICNICPRECGADRETENGICGCGEKIHISRAAPHFWEEPPISHKNGSGTVFFAGCNLKCVFCQNGEISRCETGKEVTAERLYEIFWELKAMGVHNINLVTPTHYTEQIIPVLRKAKAEGFPLPIVWNSGGYEKAETIKMLNGLVDVYLPDLKYIRPETALRYSGAKDYFEYACAAIDEMVKQRGNAVIHRGTMRRGVIVRHLILPGHTEESKEIIKYLHARYGNSIYISIMNQYTPMERVKNTHPEIYRTVTEAEYVEVVEFAKLIGVENAFVQDGDTAKESFIPPFDNQGV
jgi:putative pyruvate formate lyase activating enzyme